MGGAQGRGRGEGHRREPCARSGAASRPGARGRRGAGSREPRAPAASERKAEPAGRAVEVRSRVELEGILGFQPLALAQAARCALCGRKLRPGERAYLGVRGGDGPPAIIGQSCLPAAMSTEEQENER